MSVISTQNFSPPRPSSPDLKEPFFMMMVPRDGLFEEEMREKLTEEERKPTENFLRQMENEAKQRFMEEVRRKQFAHIFNAEPPTPKKGEKK